MHDLQPNELQDRLKKLHRDGEERAAERLAQRLGLSYADLSKAPISLDAVRVIPEATARDAKAIGIEIKANRLAVGAVNPELPATKKLASDLAAQKYDVKMVVISPASLDSAWHFYQFIKPEAEVITGTVKITKERIDDLRKRLTTIEAVSKEIAANDIKKLQPEPLIEIILAGAMAMRASDIHTEAGEKMAKIRFRIDGLLHDIFDEIPPDRYQTFVSRIKLFSGMKLNIRDIAQDGRFTIAIGDKEIEMRVSVIPAEFGETIVMRILDPAATMVGLKDLGLRPDSMELVRKELARPNGLILNTGPTGSGKTTTLYAFLRSINNPEIKIITLEDPIEYRIEGIEQTQVAEKAGYTFANGLRAIVRQDPDVILVGEVRDLETADIAMQAALTGHLVLSTLHTNDAVGAVPRLINLGVKAVSIGPALTLVIAQRLVRILCKECKKKITPDAALAGKIKKFVDALPAAVDKKPYQAYDMYEAVGCPKCNGLGYKGRVGIFEFLQGGPGLEQTILKEASEVALRQVAENQEMVTMQEDGILKVIAGVTTFSEVESVTGEIQWK
ncbi:MAG TPA: GspE/PulE family protein [Candidatus Paceibacterota bacterium]|nr:GspE/PulE family protein [Candidatus Paceibacterota bacterium]